VKKEEGKKLVPLSKRIFKNDQFGWIAGNSSTEEKEK